MFSYGNFERFDPEPREAQSSNSPTQKFTIFMNRNGDSFIPLNILALIIASTK